MDEPDGWRAVGAGSGVTLAVFTARMESGPLAASTLHPLPPKPWYGSVSLEGEEPPPGRP